MSYICEGCGQTRATEDVASRLRHKGICTGNLQIATVSCPIGCGVEVYCRVPEIGWWERNHMEIRHGMKTRRQLREVNRVAT